MDLNKRKFLLGGGLLVLAKFYFAKDAFASVRNSKLASVRGFGAIGDGVHDDSNAILRAFNADSVVEFPRGRYKYTSNSNPDFSKGFLFNQDAHIDGLNSKDIFVFDRDGKTPVGLQHNHLEQNQFQLAGTKKVNTGVIFPPPLSMKKNDFDIDVIAHWYNDFGLEYTRVGNGVNGGLTWYYWSWAFSNNETGYDPSRHPLLGWYRGDDANVLDWQCYWLREYGVKGVNLVGEIDLHGWSSPTHRDYWKYQLFHNVKNFKGLQYILWVAFRDTPSLIISNWFAVVDFLKKYNNYYFYKINGVSYPVLYIFDFGMLFKVFHKSEDELFVFFKNISRHAKKMGFKGLVFFVRKSIKLDLIANGSLAGEGIFLIPAGYSNINGSSGKTYNDLVNSFATPSEIEVVNVATSKLSKAPHPSSWSYKGSTPELFQSLLWKATNLIRQSKHLPRVIQIYNVAEWAEGGPGLQPNCKDGFKYLQALKNVVSK